MAYILRIIVWIMTLYFYEPNISYANSMIDNNAYGYVGGTISQVAKRHAVNQLNVGSISHSRGASSLRRVTVRAFVKGNIRMEAAENTKLVLNIGSVHNK
jgi:hypothetical protein